MLCPLDSLPPRSETAHVRRLILGGATLAVAADLSVGATPAQAAIPSPPQVPEVYDLGDLQTQSALPPSALITITVDDQGVAHFAIPRAEVGQGITTAAAMVMRFEFMFRSSAALEPNCAIADVRATSATVRAGLKSPIVAQKNIADALGMLQTSVTVNVVTGGGSLGHRLFGDAALESAKISKAMGKPVKLMWHRADEPRQGRTHPMATSRIRATVRPATC